MAKVAGSMNSTFAFSVASLVFGVIFFVGSIIMLKASPVDIGLVSTAMIFLLAGGVGLALNKTNA